jgi:hypothetical protein
MGMIVALSLAVLGGVGTSQLAHASRRWKPVVWIAVLAFLLEATSAPIETNVPFNALGLRQTPVGIETGLKIPPVYRYLASLQPDSVVIEFPFGDGAYDVRYVYYSTVHWRRIVNGYSGGFPPWYDKLAGELRWPYANQGRAFEVLARYDITHVVVHEDAYLGDTGLQVSEWLRSSGATPVAAFGHTRVFTLRPVR